MKNIFILLFLVFTTLSTAQIINIPDANFKNRLLTCAICAVHADGTNGADKNKDGEIQQSEAESIVKLLLPNSNIISLEGIEAFINLKDLNCQSNKIVSINLSANTQLKTLSVNSNSLTSIDISNQIQLDSFLCDFNKIINLDISKNPVLRYLRCSNSDLSTIRFNTFLKSLTCNNTKVSDLTDMPSTIQYLNLLGNKLTKLDLENFSDLTYLNAEKNLITNFVQPEFSKLKTIYFRDNRLDSLIITDMSLLTDLRMDENNPNLKKIVVKRNPLLKILSLGNSSSPNYIDVSHNDLTTLNLSNMYQISHLDYSHNKITGFYTGNNAGILKYLDASNNAITSVVQYLDDIYGSLTYFDISHNVPTQISLAKLPNIDLDLPTFGDLTYMEIGGAKSFKLSPQPKLATLKTLGDVGQQIILDGHPNLKEIQISKNCKSVRILNSATSSLNLSIFNTEIDSLVIYNFPNITSFTIQSNKVKQLKLEKLNKLQSLTISLPILSLKMNSLPILKQLTLQGNQSNSKINLELTGKDLPLLEYIDVGGYSVNEIQLRDLINLKNVFQLWADKPSFSNLPALQNLTIYNAKLINNSVEKLILNNFKSLEKIKLEWNNNENSGLKEVVFLNVPKLSDINLNFKNIPEINNIDLSACKQLNKLYIASSGVIHLLNLKNNNSEWSSFWVPSGSLKSICVDDENEIQKIIALVPQFTWPQNTTVFNSSCSFSSGYQYNLLTGKIKLELASDTCRNSTGVATLIPLTLSENNNKYHTFSDLKGEYHIYPESLNKPYRLKTDEELNHYTLFDPPTDISFDKFYDTKTLDLCFIPNGIHHDLEVTIIPVDRARPGFDSKYKLVYKNKGNTILSGEVSFSFDDDYADLVSSVPGTDLQSEGQLMYKYTELKPFESGEIFITLHLNAPTDTPALNDNEILIFTSIISSDKSESTPSDNTFKLSQTVVNSNDPNDKTCLQGQKINPELVGKYVDYIIRFENLGTAEAVNVTIRDVIDLKTFDINSLKPTDASHPFETKISDGNVVEFIFENINLPYDDANNDGYIAFRIKTLPTLVLGDSLKNLADIYFDYNFPIRTNEAKTTVALSVSATDRISSDVKIFPNPVKDILQISTDKVWTKAEIYDIAGRILRSLPLNGSAIDVSNLKSGTYIILLRNGDKVGNIKFVKM
ncbi:MAG: T9SS type A sorting domain-containing protein [Saprospiraceae bacterium]|nr:T9SS type A sorting domain-containing protein [Saprospiraceae bacterium]